MSSSNNHAILEEQPLTIQTKEGTEVSYIMRGLKEEEIDTWAAFCASVFSYKANPPPASYFARHYYNDPHRSAELVRVVFHNDGTNNEIVASCRVFPRTISIGNGRSVSAGGIGEVCTSPEHRRRGLSKVLLQNAIEIMTLHKMELSLLHAAPAFFPVYESSGYACTTSPWSVVQVDPTKLSTIANNNDNHLIRQAQFPSDTPRLQAIHQQFTEQKLAGTIIRSEQYWNEYLSQELDQSLWVFSKEDTIVACLSIRPRGENLYQLREFGCDQNGSLVEGASSSYACYFGPLLRQALLQLEANKEPFSLQLPTFILANMEGDNEYTAYIDWTSRTEENDSGWMYRPICPSTEAVVQKGMPKITEIIPHLVWPSDSF